MSEHKGYDILVPEELYKYKTSSKHDHDVFIVAIPFWLLQELYIELNDELEEVEIDIINVKYLGSYPALGISSDAINAYDKRYNFIEATCNRLLKHKPLHEFIAFMMSDDRDWVEVTKSIMK